MFVLIFLTVTFFIIWLFYLSISKCYTNKLYILKEINGDNKKVKIRGNYINITYDGECVRIDKDAEDNWYYTKNEVKKSLRNGETIKIGNKEFQITAEETKGGFWTLLPLITTFATIFMLYHQGNYIINNESESNNFVEEIEQPKPQDDNIGDITENNEIIIKENTDNINYEAKDIHSIVQKYDSLFQNNISINWDAYSVDENMRRILNDSLSEAGISISKYQGIIDWEKVKLDGINYAIIRVGSRGYKDGDLKIDPKFKENMDGATTNNIKIGVYFFSQAINQKEMDDEIDLILQSIKEYTLDYPIGIGFERKDIYRTNNLTDEESIELIKYFCIKMKQNGYTPMIMGTEEWFQEFPDKTFDGYLKLVSSETAISNNIDNCIIWEYEENAEGVDGINVEFELSVSAYVYENNVFN